MKNNKDAFTMIELIFVIVILGVLASIAIPKLGSVKITAGIAMARSDLAAIRSSIMSERQRSLVQGDASYITKLTPATTDNMLFTGDGAGRTLLTYGIKKGSSAGEWDINSDTQYEFNSGTQVTVFDYNTTTGLFSCTSGLNDCDALSN